MYQVESHALIWNPLAILGEPWGRIPWKGFLSCSVGKKKKSVWLLCFVVVVVFPTILYLALKKKKQKKKPKNFITAKCRTAGRDITCTVTKSLRNWGFKLFFSSFPYFRMMMWALIPVTLLFREICAILHLWGGYSNSSWGGKWK